MRGVLLIMISAGCTQLGAMPTTTGIAAVPAGRPGGEVQIGLMPIHRLSTATRGEERNGDSISHISALFDPDALLGVPGLFVAGRAWGKDGDTSVEPMLGYRHSMGALSIAGVGYGTKASGSSNGASYEAVRVGGELIVDAVALQLAASGALHVQGALNATYISATGEYCVGQDGNGVDCAEDGSVPRIDGDLAGLYSAATLTLSLDIGRSSKSNFHGARLAAMLSGGHMPRLINGSQRKGDLFLTGGVTLTVGFGSK
jgi:hypothetical protein